MIRKTINRSYLFLSCSFAFMAPPYIANAQQNVWLYYAVTNSVFDENNVLLEGRAEAPGDLVQVLRADSGIFPPATDGSPHPANPILGEIRVGMGTDPFLGAVGKFAGWVVINRSVPNPMFVRVFNGYTMQESSFYGDSQIYTNPLAYSDNFIVRVRSTDSPLDSGDDDNDYLSNSWEKSRGTDPLDPDSDGDGVLDGEEVVAGTNPLDENDFLRMVKISHIDDQTIIVSWDSVSNKHYQVEFGVDMPADESPYLPLGDSLVATGSWSWLMVTNAAEFTNSSFRVRLLVP